MKNEIKTWNEYLNTVENRVMDWLNYVIKKSEPMNMRDFNGDFEYAFQDENLSNTVMESLPTYTQDIRSIFATIPSDCINFNEFPVNRNEDFEKAALGMIYTATLDKVLDDRDHYYGMLEDGFVVGHSGFSKHDC